MWMRLRVREQLHRRRQTNCHPERSYRSYADATFVILSGAGSAPSAESCGVEGTPCWYALATARKGIHTMPMREFLSRPVAPLICNGAFDCVGQPSPLPQ